MNSHSIPIHAAVVAIHGMLCVLQKYITYTRYYKFALVIQFELKETQFQTNIKIVSN